MTEKSTSSTDHLNMLVYLLFLLAAVFLGPFKAVLGLAVYWLIRPETSRNGAVE